MPTSWKIVLALALLAVAVLQVRGASPVAPGPGPVAAGSPVLESSALTVDEGLVASARSLRRFLVGGGAADLQEARQALDGTRPHTLATIYRALACELAGDPKAAEAALDSGRVPRDLYDYYVQDRGKLSEVLSAYLLDQCGRRVEVLRHAALLYVRTHGRAPDRLADLVPDCTDAIRPCPATGEASYEAGWTHDGASFGIRCRHGKNEVVASDRSSIQIEGGDPLPGILGHVQIGQGLFDRARWTPLLLEAAQVRPGQVVADVGCGVGVFTLPLARAVGPKGKVYAVDVNPSVLDCVRFLADRQPELRIEAVLSQTGDARLPRGGVDTVFLIHVYHVLVDADHPRDEQRFRRDIAPLLESLRAALKPGGKLVVVDTRPVRPEDRSHVAPELVRDQLGQLGFRRLSGRTFEEAQFVEIFTP